MSTFKPPSRSCVVNAPTSTVAYKQAALNAIAYLQKLGYSALLFLPVPQLPLNRLINAHIQRENKLVSTVDSVQQRLIAHLFHLLDLLLSAAPIESHVGAIVDSPNACVTLGIPTGIFEQVRLYLSIEARGFV